MYYSFNFQEVAEIFAQVAKVEKAHEAHKAAREAYDNNADDPNTYFVVDLMRQEEKARKNWVKAAKKALELMGMNARDSYENAIYFCKLNQSYEENFLTGAIRRAAFECADKARESYR